MQIWSSLAKERGEGNLVGPLGRRDGYDALAADAGSKRHAIEYPIKVRALMTSNRQTTNCQCRLQRR